MNQEEIKKQSKFKKGCLGCLSLFLIVFGTLFLLWFILVERHFIFIRYEIYGRITDKETKRPIENALVVFGWRAEVGGWQEYDATITDEKGIYKLPKKLVVNFDATQRYDFYNKRDGCVLVSWFPGYFRDEKWESGNKLIKGRQDFSLQRAKTREEVVRSLKENTKVNVTFYSWRLFTSSHKGNDIKMIYNPNNVDIIEYYWLKYKEFKMPERFKYDVDFFDK